MKCDAVEYTDRFRGQCSADLVFVLRLDDEHALYECPYQHGARVVKDKAVTHGD